MASGTIKLTRYGSGLMYGQIVWSSVSNGTEANTSTVTASIQVCRSAGYTTSGTWWGSLQVGGKTQSFSTYSSISSGWVTMATVTATVNHNTNGSGSCFIYGVINGPTETTMQGTNTSGSATVALDTILRQATMEYVADFNDEENPAISYTNPLGSSVPSLQAGISLTQSSSNVIEYHDVDKIHGADTIALTDSERNTLRAAVTGGNTRTVWIYLRTRIGETYYYSPMPATLTIKNPHPTISPTIKDSNSTTIALTGNSSKLIKYYSNASITIGATAVKQASLASKKVTCGNKSLTADGTINAIESGSFVFTATDSRGNTTIKTVIPSFVDYIKLTCSLANNMPDGDGNMTVKATGNYFNGSFGSKSNSLNVYYRYKVSGGTYSDWTAMTVAKNGNIYSATANLTGLDYQTTYVIQTYAVDALATVYSEEKPVKATPVFEWGASDFKFNVPVYDSFGTEFGNGLAAYTGGGDSGIDPNTTLEELCLTSHSNAPQGLGTFYYIHTAFYNTKSATAARTQFALPYNKVGSLYYRYYASGAWSAWQRMTNDSDFITTAGTENPDTTKKRLILTNTNTPMGSGYYMYIQTMFNGDPSSATYRSQLAIPYNRIGSTYHRYYTGSAWSDWRRHLNEDENFVQMKLLWENDSPTSTFASKSISISNIANYDIVRISFEMVAGGSSWDIHTFENYNGHSEKCSASASFYDNGVYVTHRPYTINWANNSIAFDDAKQNGSTRNDRMIPYKIFGIKGVT